MILTIKDEKQIEALKNGTKIHAIIDDKKDRWKVGVMAHPKLYENTDLTIHPCKLIEQWKGIPIKGVQKIEFLYNTNIPAILIDGQSIGKSKAIKIAKNEGFKGMKDFLKKYNKNYKGKIAHFTDFLY